MARDRVTPRERAVDKAVTATLAVVLLLAGPGASALGAARSAKLRAQPQLVADLVSGAAGVTLPRAVAQRGPRDCGPAALATTLVWLGRPVGEAAILRAARLRADGASLAELGRLAAAFDLPGAWYAVPRQALPSLPRPFIAHLAAGGGHYVAVRWVGLGFVLLADPARGLVLERSAAFARAWSGRVLLFDAVLAAQPPAVGASGSNAAGRAAPVRAGGGAAP